jgi:hypothetical protein
MVHFVWLSVYLTLDALLRAVLLLLLTSSLGVI